MSFNFDPSIWYVCKSCRQSFPDVEKFKSHKVSNHLGECLEIKSIIFEESDFDHEWISKNNRSNSTGYPVIPTPLSNLDKKRKLQNTLSYHAASIDLARQPKIQLDRLRKTIFSEPPLPPEEYQKTISTNIIPTSLKPFSDDDDDCSGPASPNANVSDSANDSESDDRDHDPDHGSTSAMIENIQDLLEIKLEPGTDTENTDEELEEEEEEEEDEDSSSHSEYEVKPRGRGRPRKFPLRSSTRTTTTAPAKRGRGRPPNSSTTQKTPKEKKMKKEKPPKKPKGQKGQKPKRPQVHIESKCDLSEWLRFQRQIQNSDGSSSVILVDPEPKQGESDKITQEEPVSCRLCLKKFVCAREVQLHVITCWSHEKQEHRYCVICDSGFDTPAEFKAHRLKDHPEEEPEYERELQKQETAKNTGDGKTNFPCQVCGVNFTVKCKLLYHMDFHSDYRPYKCPHCSVWRKNKKLLRSHMAVLHGTINAIKCQFCEKTFDGDRARECHERTHTGDRPYKCDIPKCISAFASPNALYTHKRVKHSEDVERYPCPTCGKTFGVKSYLNTHIHRVHTDDRPFKCTHEGCTKALKLKSQLIEHMRKHSGEKPFQCEECGQAFARIWTFTRHTRLHDGTLNRVLCHLCPMKFPGSYELKKHLKVHEAGNTFKCGTCGVEYGTQMQLKNHEKSHDNNTGTNNANSSSNNSSSHHQPLTSRSQHDFLWSGF